MSILNYKIAFFLLAFSSLIIFILVFPVYIYDYFDYDDDQMLMCNATKDENFKCPENSFTCKTCPNVCVPWTDRCNGEKNCPDDSDEDKSMCDDNSGIYSMNDSPHHTKTRNQLKPEHCPVEVWKDWRDCPCDTSWSDYIHCNNAGLTSIPNDLKSTVKRLLLLGNKITSIDNVTWPRSLESLKAAENSIERVNFATFANLPNFTTFLLPDNNLSEIDLNPKVRLNLVRLILDSNKLTTFDTNLLLNMPQLWELGLSNNYISDFTPDTRFSRGKSLTRLYLSHNNIKVVKSQWFSNMTNLNLLYLLGNNIERIEEGSFDYDVNLLELNLENNKIKHLTRFTFVSRYLDPKVAAPYNMSRLYLGENPLKPWANDTFDDFKNLTSLQLEGIEFDNVKALKLPQAIAFIYFKKYVYCQYAPARAICKPITDGVSKKDKLLAYPSLEKALLMMAIICTLGNVSVFVWRSISRERDDILDACIKNLSVADLMMGLYLCAIYWKDSESGLNNTNTSTFEWKSSWICTAFGFVAVLSSELSVFILMIITIERYRSVVSCETTDRRANKRRAKYYVIFAWLASCFIALYPLQERLISDNGQDIYSTSHLCLPLRIEEPFTSGWAYSTFIYVGINGVALLTMVVLYVRMYRNIMHLHHKVNLVTAARRHEDAILALRFIFIVIADCLCWLPIVVVKIMAFFKLSETKPWTIRYLVVFIIPINSALNPIIYTLAAPSSLRSALCRPLERLRRFINMTSRKYLSSLEGQRNSWLSTGRTRHSSDELSQSGYSRRRRKTGSNSTTCDTVDSSQASHAGSSLMQPDRHLVEVGDLQEHQSSHGASSTTETSNEFSSQSPPAYESLVTY